MPVRSLKFASGVGTSGSQINVYTCPAGRTAIVKDVRVWGNGSGLSRVAVYVVSGPTQVSLIDSGLGGVEAKAVAAAFAVLEPGDSLQVYCQGGVAAYWISGAELDGVA